MPDDGKYEAETVLRYNETNEDAYLWSASRVFQRHMEKLGISPEKTQEREGTAPSMWYRVPKVWVVVRKPQKREFTDEQRKAIGERLGKGRFKPQTPYNQKENSPSDPQSGPNPAPKE